MKKKFLLLGGYKSNAGPHNVNRSYIENSDGSMSYIKTSGIRIINRLENLIKIIFYPTILFSGGVPNIEFKLCRILHKRTFYLMHGCTKFENIVNQLNLPESALKKEDFVLKNIHKIITVSSNFAEWVKKEYPEYADKITFCTNGIELSEPYEHITRTDKNRIIALTGGNRLIKRNYYICKAVENLNKKGWNIRVKAFGRNHSNGEPIYDFKFVDKMGQMGKNEYYKQLEESDLLCVNSDLESFGLVVCDALNCGSSLLMSKNVGATCIFNDLQDDDLIKDNRNIIEIASKIENLLHKSNSKRLYYSIDQEKYSEKQSFLRLKQICLYE